MLSLYIAPSGDGLRHYFPLFIMLLQQADKRGLSRR